MSKFVILDRDGTIIKDGGYVHKIDELEFLPGAISGLKKLQKLGYQFIIVTNQAGIARKLYSLKDAEKFNKELAARLAAEGIKIKRIYLCPHHPDFTGECVCRKPKIELALKAAKEFDIDLPRSIFIGDKDSDIQFGKNCGGVTILIKNNDYPNAEKADFEALNLEETAQLLT